MTLQNCPLFTHRVNASLKIYCFCFLFFFSFLGKRKFLTNLFFTGIVVLLVIQSLNLKKFTRFARGQENKTIKFENKPIKFENRTIIFGNKNHKFEPKNTTINPYSVSNFFKSYKFINKYSRRYNVTVDVRPKIILGPKEYYENISDFDKIKILPQIIHQTSSKNPVSIYYKVC